MRRILQLAVLLLCAVPAFGQQTPISATITDPNGVPYNFGVGYSALRCPGNQQPTFNGSPIIQSSVPIPGIDGNGFFSMKLYDLNAIQPTGCVYTFAICWQDQITCFTTGNITGITGAGNVDLSAAISAFSVPLPASATGGGVAGGTPFQMQVNKGGAPPKFGGTACTSLDLFPGATQERHDCDERYRGPNPWVDITRFGARSFTLPVSQTTANCNGTTSVTLTSAIDFINGDGIVLHQCGPATALATPAAPSSVTPKGILNGATTRCYKIVVEDSSLGTTAASPSTCTSTAASGFQTTAVNLTSCTFNAGTLSCTASANHNFEVGTVIRINGTTSAFGGIDAIYYVQTTPSGTTFTCSAINKNRPDFLRNVTGGTAEAPAHIWVKWTAQNNVMRSWIYRQDGGAGNFNLVGVMPAQEPFFDDYNFTAPTRPPEIPATAPASASNQALATKIVSGAGTTSIVVANSASSTISGITALHDNTVAWIAAANQAYTNNGGPVMIPATGTPQDLFVTNFPLSLPGFTNNSMVRYLVAGNIFANQPILVPSQTEFDGYGARQSGAPAFQTTTNYGVINGAGYPLIQIFAGGVTIDHMYIDGSHNPQQWALFAGEGNNGAGSAALRLNHSYLAASMPGGFPVVLRGTGFTFQAENTVFTEGGVTSAFYYYAAGLRLMGSGITNPQGFWGDAEVYKAQFIGAGVSVDGDAASSLANGPNAWTFRYVFSEAACAPLFNARNVSSSNWFGWTLDNIDPSDAQSACGGTFTPILDFSSPTVSGLSGMTINPSSIGSLGATGSTSVIVGSTNGVTFNGGSVNDGYNLGTSAYASIPLQTYNINSGSPTAAPQKAFESNGAFRAIPPGLFFVQGNPPTSVNAAIQAGGSVPVQTNNVNVTAVDWNNGESIFSLPAVATTTSGNQTILVTWTPPSPAPQGYNVYWGGARQNASLITVATFTISSITSFGTQSFASGGGPVGMSSTGVWTNQTRYTAGQFKTDISAGTLTANRAVTWPDGSGNVLLDSTPLSKAIQSQSFTSLSGNVSVGNTATTITSLALTMPSSGCPCRVRIDYGLYLDFPNTNVSAWAFWVNDGTAGATHTLASLQTDQSNGATGARTSANAGAWSQLTYSNNAAVTFTLFGQGTGATTMTVEAAPQVGSGTNSWMSAVIATSN